MKSGAKFGDFCFKIQPRYTLLNVEGKCFPLFNEALTGYPIVISLLVFFITSVSCLAQQRHESMVNGPEVIESLAAGVLVCVIPDYSQKLEILERDLAVEKSLRRSKRLKKLINQTRLDRDQFKKELILAIDSLYDFSKVAFISSSDLPGLDKMVDQIVPLRGNFVDADDEIFFLIRGQVESGADALIITDADLNPLGRPYPYYVRLQGVVSLIESFFSAGDTWKGMDKTIGKLNERLHRFLSI